MSKIFLSVSALFLLIGCVATSGNQFQSQFPVGKVFRDKVELPQGDVILPEGEWKVLATDTGHNNTYHSLGSLALGRIDSDGFLRGLVTLSTPLDVGLGYAFYSSSFCDPQPNLLYHHTNANVNLGRQSCFGVKKKTISSFDNFADYVKVAMTNARSMNADRPYYMLSAAFRITRRNKYLYVEYGFDYRESGERMLPGFASGEDIQLTRKFFPEDKEENVDAVVRWASENADRIEEAFLD